MRAFLRYLRSVMSSGTPDSSKRLIACVAAGCLCGVTSVLAGALCWQAWHFRAVDAQLVVAFIASLTATAALAGVAYRKPEGA